MSYDNRDRHAEATLAICHKAAEQGLPTAQLALALLNAARRAGPKDLVYAYMVLDRKRTDLLKPRTMSTSPWPWTKSWEPNKEPQSGCARPIGFRFPQRRVFVNDLAVRRAIDELQQVHDYDHLYSVLVSAFNENEFDGFELRLHSPPGRFPEIRIDNMPKRDGDSLCLWWRKPGSFLRGSGHGWCISLDLVSEGQDRASLSIYRHYNERPLQFDVNLLTAEFPVALAKALTRARVRTRRMSGTIENEATARVAAEAS